MNQLLHMLTHAKAIMEQLPEWFQNGMEAALLAPTAMNQQKFLFTLSGRQVAAKAGMGFYAKIDLGIVKYHFEVVPVRKILSGVLNIALCTQHSLPTRRSPHSAAVHRRQFL